MRILREVIFCCNLQEKGERLKRVRGVKKKILALFMTGSVILAGGCGSAGSVQQEQQMEVSDGAAAAAGDVLSQREDGSVQDEAAEQPQDAGQADLDGLSDVLESVYSAVPGTAGSSLKSVIAAGAILDWAEDNYALSSDAEIMAAVSDWRAKKQESAGDVYSDGDMLDALAGADADAKLILSDRTGMAELLEESGAVLLHEQYTAERYQAVTGIFVNSFTK